MRGATVLVSGSAATWVVVALALVPAAGAAPAREPARYSLAIALRSEGFKVYLSNESDGDTASLTIVRGREIAAYQTKVSFTPRSVEARFGSLGLVDLQFRPVPATDRRGALRHEGEFRGTIAFTGEHGYIHLDAPRVHGSLETYAPGGSKRAGAAAAREDEVTLRAIERRGHAEGRYLSAYGARTKGDVRTYVDGGEVERREGMTIIRAAQASAGPSAFHWSLATGRATIDPPAPFTGTAVFRRRPGGRARWSGSLRAPLLGVRRPVRLVGPTFRAKLFHQAFHDERPGPGGGGRDAR